MLSRNDAVLDRKSTLVWVKNSIWNSIVTWNEHKNLSVAIIDSSVLKKCLNSKHTLGTGLSHDCHWFYLKKKKMRESLFPCVPLRWQINSAKYFCCTLNYEVHTISFQTFFIWAPLLIVHTWNSSPLRNNFLGLQCTCSTVPIISGRPHGSLLVWVCVNDLCHSLFYLLNYLITTGSELRE